MEELRKKEEYQRNRARGEGFQITAVFRYEGPLGLSFKVDQDCVCV